MDMDGIEQLITQQFAGVNRRFDGLDREIRDMKSDLRHVKYETRKTNGRVNEHDRSIAGIEPRLSSVVKDVDELKESGGSVRSTVTIETGEARRITRWDVMVFAAGGGSIWALIKFVSWSIHSISQL